MTAHRLRGGSLPESDTGETVWSVIFVLDDGESPTVYADAA